MEIWWDLKNEHLISGSVYYMRICFKENQSWKHSFLLYVFSCYQCWEARFQQPKGLHRQRWPTNLGMNRWLDWYFRGKGLITCIQSRNILCGKRAMQMIQGIQVWPSEKQTLWWPQHSQVTTRAFFKRLGFWGPEALELSSFVDMSWMTWCWGTMQWLAQRWVGGCVGKRRVLRRLHVPPE